MITSRTMRIPYATAVTLVAALATVGWCMGQVPAALATGAVEVDLAGEPHVFRTYAVDIPEDVAEGIEDEALRARLEKAAGTTVHSATWDVPEPVMMNEMVLFEASDMYVAVTSRASADPDAGLGELRMNFGLNLATLALSDPAAVGISVRYYPETFTVADYYELTEGGVELVDVERVGERTLRIRGTFAGVFSFQATRGVVAHDPSDTLPATGSFDLLEVVGAAALSDVLVDDR